MKRRDLLKSALGLTALGGLSAMKPLYASDAMEFKADPMYDVPVTKVSDRCYYLLADDPEPTPDNHAFFNNPGFIVTSEGVVVVDTGSSVQIGEMVLRQIKTVTDKPVVKVINTHFHGDHFLGNHAFVEANPDVEIYGHPETIKGIKKDGEFWYDFMQKYSNNGITGTISTPPNKTFNGGEVLKMGDTTIKIHQFGQAHTVADLIVEVVEDKTVFLGDTAMRRVANMRDGSFPGTIETMKQVKALGAKHFILGHGKHDDVSICDDMQVFMENIYNSAMKYYDEEGLSDFEMKPMILDQPFMKDVASKWPGYDGTIGNFISLAVAEVEKNMF